ncbi:MAG: GtrA-like protein [Candidatus Accumulibacter regalis]|uniref:GtrA-like protein n=1 Tax=Accumulibacter regalis TaxID=522306 RepID=A0A011R8V9_ACCRE|nr:GtrA family protein [Accumulibacter sp.]EXI87574.1 MAG: GtrA-like protein [Candidatus Accumulibacter regalis]HRE69602.1 GtrA family protein [Accumulibacter sp.]HRI91841.1 GtrA family protein [Accumulibacter sp.]
MRQILRQFTQYVLVGGLAFAVDFVALFVLTEYGGIHYLASAAISFSMGLIISYLLCIAWVFDYRALKNRAHEFFLFFLVGMAGLVLNTLLLFVFTESFGLHYLLSKLVAAALILLFNFSLRRSLLFSVRKRPCPETP